MKAVWGVLIVILTGAGVWGALALRNQPPEIPFAKALREPIASSVPTNGKVEPIEFAEARAERAGPVNAIFVQRGSSVAKGAALVSLDASDARAELATAQSRVSQIKADLETMDKGGRATDLSQIAGDIEHQKLELTSAQKDYDALVRLEAKQAATKFEVTQAKERVDRAQSEIRSLEQRKTALTNPIDRSAAEARLHDAESAVALAQERIEKSTFRAPIAGTVYQFDIKPGAYLNAGDLVASIGQLSRVRIKVFVDEPDLGRVAVSKPVVITWDARPGVQWKGIVDKTPTQIVAMGTRQVGEVLCVIDNPRGELLPGTNVNVDILSEEAASAITIPKEAVRKENGETGVYVLAKNSNGDAVAWKKITLGIGNTTRTQVEGLNEGDQVALPSEKNLKNGMTVSPQVR